MENKEKKILQQIWSYYLIFIPYMVLVLPYGILCLTYVHVAVEFGFVIFAICKLPKEKNVKIFLMTLGLTGVSVAMNLYWSTRWIMYMGV